MSASAVSADLALAPAPVDAAYRPPSAFDLYQDFQHGPKPARGALLSLHGIEGLDAYNPTLIHDRGHTYLAVRCESHHSVWRTAVYDAHALFFRLEEGEWRLDDAAPQYRPLEDPFAAWVVERGERLLVLGGVYANDDPVKPGIETRFFKGRSVYELEREPFAVIPGMKDIRLVQRKHKREIVVCTRPQGGPAGLGTIGVTTITSLDQLNRDTIDAASLLLGQVDAGTKLGSNQLQLIETLDDHGHLVEHIGVLGHIIHEDAQRRHYYAMAFQFNPDDLEATPANLLTPRIIAESSNFPTCSAKDPSLDDVLFPSGLEDLGHGYARLYTGVNDTHVGTITIPHPFVRAV